MAIAPLIVGVRTAGAAALGRLSTSFLRLRASIRVASSAAVSSFIFRGGFPGAISRLAARFRLLAGSIGRATRALVMYALASRVARGASSALGNALSTAVPMFAKFAVIAGAVVALLPALVGITTNLSGAIMLIAPAAFAAASGFAVWKMALSGFSDVLKASDPKELAEALKKLPPNAASAALTLRDLGREWKTTQQVVQNRFFAGARDDFIAVSRAVQPIADKWLPKMADAFANARHALRFVFTEAAKSGQLDKIFAGVNDFFHGLLNAVAPLAQAFFDIAEVAAPAFGKLGGSIAGLANKFADWIRQAKESGKLQEWLGKALSTLDKFKTIAGNIVGIFQALFSAGEDDGQALLDRLISITEATEKWLKSANGQTFLDLFNAIAAGFAFISPFFQLWIGYMEAVGVAAGFLKEVFVNLWAGIKAIGLAVALAIVGHLNMVLTAAEKALGWIPGLGPKLRAAKAQFDEYARGVQNALEGIPDQIVNITFRARRIGDFTYSGAQLGGSYSSGIGGRAQGGPVRAGMTYKVNEGGQEYVTFGQSGWVHNARDSAAMSGGSTWVPAPTNAYRGLLRAFEKAQRREVRGRARGSSQRYLAGTAPL